MNLILIVLIILLPSQQGPFNKIEDCLYIDAVKVYDSTATVMLPSPIYQFPLAWNSTQNSVTKYSHSFMGYQVSDPTAIFGFDAYLSDINPINGILNFKPIPLSSIIFLHFSIILLKSSSQYITLKSVSINPVNFTAGRSNGHFQWYNVSLDRNFTSETYNYLTSAFLSSFRTQYFNGMQQISIALQPINAGANYHTIKLAAYTSYENVYSNICLTYLLLYLPSFNYRLNFISDFFYFYAGVVHSMATSPSAADNYLPPFQKCIFGMQWYRIHALGPSFGAKFELLYPGTRTSFVTDYTFTSYFNAMFLERALCLGACPKGYYVYHQAYNTAYQCLLCSNLVSNCSSCTPFGGCDECSDNYFLLPAANHCYFQCPLEYYGDIGSKHCLPCRTQCLKCSNFSSCVTCKKGWPAEGGCTTVSGCSNVSDSICVNCTARDYYEINGTTCSCISPYFFVSNLCINITGCITAKKVGNQPLCYACNLTLNFVLANNKCDCRDGYEPSGNKCTQKCGDGKLFTLDCDDGNRIDGDGCSGSCKVQYKYKCENASSSSPSVCKYVRKDLGLSIQTINKVDSINRAQFTFVIYPNLLNLAKNNFSQAVTLNCSQKSSISSVTFANGTLTVLVDYFQTLQDNFANVTVSLDKKYFRQGDISASLRMNSMGEKLIFSNRLQTIQFYKFILIGISGFALLVFLLSSIAHKIVGLELLHTFQVIYFAHFSTRSYTNCYGVLRYLQFSAWNFLNFPKGFTHIDSASNHLFFNLNSQLFTKIILLILSIIIAVTFILKQPKIDLSNKEANQNKIFVDKKTPNWLQTVFQALSNILIGSVLVILLIISTKDVSSQPAHPWLSYSITLVVIIGAFTFGRQFKYYSKDNMPSSSMVFNKNKRTYLQTYLCIILTTAFLISLNYHYQDLMAIYPLLGLQCILFILIIKNTPYKSPLDIFGAIMIRITSAYFLIWSVIRQQFSQLQIEENQIGALAFLSLFFFLISFLGLLRIIYELKSRLNKQKENTKQHGQVDSKHKDKQENQVRKSWKRYYQQIKEKQKANFAWKIVDQFYQKRLKSKQIMRKQKKAFLLKQGIT